jgi:hypothetical protein
MGLTRQECSELFKAVEDGGLDPGQCELVNLAHRPWVTISHRLSSNRVGIRRIDKQLFGFLRGRSPGVAFECAIGNGKSLRWPAILDSVSQWSSEIAAHDIWAELSAISIPITGSAHRNIPNTPFTVEQQTAIAHRIEDVKTQARENPELTAEQISGIEQKLDELVAASKRVGPKDWLVMLYGTAFGLIINDGVPPHVVQGIITGVITGLGHILGVGGPPPVLPA